MIRKNYPVAIGNRVGARDVEEVSSGACGYSASPLQFLGHPEPAQALL